MRNSIESGISKTNNNVNYPAVYGQRPTSYLEVKQIEPNKTTYMEGFKMWLELKTTTEDDEPTDETAIHEAQHVIGARKNGTKTVKASILPEGDSLGHTIFEKPDIVGAMAPHSVGANGTGHDVRIANMLGNAKVFAHLFLQY